MLIIIGLIIIIFTIIIIFSFPQFSPIPYFPSNQTDKGIIIEGLDLKNNQTVIDFGAGDGWVIFTAAEIAKKNKLNTKFIAVEINPVLTMILHIKRLLNSNQKNIYIIRDNFFTMNFSKLLISNSQLLTVYLYISPWLIEKTVKIIIKNFPKAKIVSYYYPVRSLKGKEKVVKGKNNLYIYQN